MKLRFLGVGGDVTVIAPKVAGFITKRFVGDNQQVHVGDLLLKLDDRDYLASLAIFEIGPQRKNSVQV